MRRLAFLILFLAVPARAQQVITPEWLAANATAYEGNPATGPWVLGAPVPGYTTPPLDQWGYRAYKLAGDVEADATAFVCAGPVRLDLAGHRVKFDAAAPVQGYNGEFELQQDGTPPSGWDTSGCVEAKPVVYSPTAHGEPVNRLFGKNVLAWTGAAKVPAAVKATASLDDSKQIVFTFAGPAPRARRQVYLLGSVFGAPTTYTWGLAYVVANPTPNSMLVSKTRDGTPMTATSVTTAPCNVGLAQVVRTSAPVELLKGDGRALYAFHHAMSAVDLGYWGGANNVACVGRVIDATTGQEIKSTIGDSLQSGGSRPFCVPCMFIPAKPMRVYLEIVVASSVGAQTVAVDGVRLTRAYNNGVIASEQYYTNFAGILQLPPKMLSGPGAYTNGKAFALVDSAGGGSIVQGPARSFGGCCINAQASGFPISAIGQRGNPIKLVATGDNTPIIFANSYAAAPNQADRTFSDLECTYGPDVDVTDRMHPAAGLILVTSRGNVSLARVNGHNVPQYWCMLDQTGDYHVTIDSCNVDGNAKVSNGYLWMFNGPIRNMEMRNCMATGSGYALAMYPGNPSATLKDCYEHIKVFNCIFDTWAQPEREYGYYNSHRVLKIKTVSPGPFPGFRDVLFQGCRFTGRSAEGAVNLVYGGQFDVRNGNNVGGNGNVRFIQCSFEALTDGKPALTGGPVFTSGFSFDQADPGNFPIFYASTFAGASCGLRLSGADGSECHGAAAISCRFAYNGSNIDADGYQVLWVGNPQSANPVCDAWLVDPMIDASIPPAHRGTHWSGWPGGAYPNSMAAQVWNYRLLDGGSGYKSKPTFTSPAGTGTGVVVAMGPDDQGNPLGSVALIGQTNYGSPTAGKVSLPQQLATFAGGSPARPARAEVALVGNSWPYRSYRLATSLRITVTESDGRTPVEGATVTLGDASGAQVFPAVPGSLNVDGSSLVPGTTDSWGRSGLARDVNLIPLPRVLVAQGDPASKSAQSSIAGTTSLDGSIKALTKGSVSATPLSPCTLTVTKPGYVTATRQIQATQPTTMVVKLARAG